MSLAARPWMDGRGRTEEVWREVSARRRVVTSHRGVALVDVTPQDGR